MWLVLFTRALDRSGHSDTPIGFAGGARLLEPGICMKNAPWRTTEIAILREHYISKGAAACAGLLPMRSRAAVEAKARQLGYRTRPAYKPIASTPQIDKALVAYYASGRRDGLSKIANTYGRSRGWLLRRAAVLGVAKPLAKKPWEAKEQRILMANKGAKIITIQARLKRAGYARSLTDIGQRIVSHGEARTDQIEDDRIETMTSMQLAAIMGVSHSKTGAWIARGGLRATHGTIDPRAWQIKRTDLRAWMLRSAEWDHRKCNREWLIDILSGR
jgi:hypothetical protein